MKFFTMINYSTGISPSIGKLFVHEHTSSEFKRYINYLTNVLR